MKVRVVFTDDFRKDLAARTRRLVIEDRRDWADRLIEEIESVATLLAASPHAGPIEMQRGRRAIRRLVLRKLPFVVWYTSHERSRSVVVLRLFHVRQRR
jgi:plasmid stabilization system protein ParE